MTAALGSIVALAGKPAVVTRGMLCLAHVERRSSIAAGRLSDAGVDRDPTRPDRLPLELTLAKRDRYYLKLEFKM